MPKRAVLLQAGVGANRDKLRFQRRTLGLADARAHARVALARQGVSLSTQAHVAANRRQTHPQGPHDLGVRRTRLHRREHPLTQIL